MVNLSMVSTRRLVIMGFLVLVLAGGVYVGREQSKKLTSPTEGEEVLSWAIYRNEKYGFEVRYQDNLTPNEKEGDSEIEGQFVRLWSVAFGTGLGGYNWIKSPYGFEIKIDDDFHEGSFRDEIVGHVANKIDSEEEVVINGYEWKKFNYEVFVTTDKVMVTSAIMNKGKYFYEVTAVALNIDQILSNFILMVDEDEALKNLLGYEASLGQEETGIFMVEKSSYSLGGAVFDENMYELVRSEELSYDLNEGKYLFAKAWKVDLGDWLGQKVKLKYRKVEGVIMGEQQLVVVDEVK